MESLLSVSCGVQGLTWTPPALHRESRCILVVKNGCPMDIGVWEIPCGVLGIPRTPQDSAWNAWGTVKSSYFQTSDGCIDVT